MPARAQRRVAFLLTDLGVTKSHSRPHTSNDNPYSEAQFKTHKYRPEFPDRFASVEQARAFCREFFSWHDDEHRHRAMGLLAPSMVHHGMADQITARRVEVLANADAIIPSTSNVAGHVHAPSLRTSGSTGRTTLLDVH